MAKIIIMTEDNIVVGTMHTDCYRFVGEEDEGQKALIKDFLKCIEAAKEKEQSSGLK
jgi:hypothetical protein